MFGDFSRKRTLRLYYFIIYKNRIGLKSETMIIVGQIHKSFHFCWHFEFNLFRIWSQKKRTKKMYIKWRAFSACDCNDAKGFVGRSVCLPAAFLRVHFCCFVCSVWRTRVAICQVFCHKHNKNRYSPMIWAQKYIVTRYIARHTDATEKKLKWTKKCYWKANIYLFEILFEFKIYCAHK